MRRPRQRGRQRRWRWQWERRVGRELCDCEIPGCERRRLSADQPDRHVFAVRRVAVPCRRTATVGHADRSGAFHGPRRRVAKSVTDVQLEWREPRSIRWVVDTVPHIDIAHRRKRTKRIDPADPNADPRVRLARRCAQSIKPPVDHVGRRELRRVDRAKTGINAIESLEYGVGWRWRQGIHPRDGSPSPCAWSSTRWLAVRARSKRRSHEEY